MAEKKLPEKRAEKKKESSTRDLLGELQKKTKEQSREKEWKQESEEKAADKEFLKIDEERLEDLIEKITTAQSIGGLLVLHASIAKDLGLPAADAPTTLKDAIGKHRAQTLGVFLPSISEADRETPEKRALCFLKYVIERYEKVLSLDRTSTVEHALARIAQIAIPGYEFSRHLHGKTIDEVDPRLLMRAVVERWEILNGPLTENDTVLASIKELHPSLADTKQGKTFITFCMTHCRAKILSANINRNDLPHEATKNPEAQTYVSALQTLARKIHGEWKTILSQCGFSRRFSVPYVGDDGIQSLYEHWEIDEKKELESALTVMSVSEALHLYAHLCAVRRKTVASPHSSPSDATEKIIDADPVAVLGLMTSLLRLKLIDEGNIHRARGIFEQYIRNFDELPIPLETKRLWRSYANVEREKTWEDYYAWNESKLIAPLRDALKALINQPWWAKILEGLSIGGAGTYLLYRRRLAMLRALRDLPSNPDVIADLALRLKIPQDCLRAIAENQEIRDAIGNVIDGVEGGMSLMDRVRVFTHAHAAKDIVKIFHRMFPNHRAYLAYHSSPFSQPSLAEIVVAAHNGYINRNGEMPWKGKTFYLFGRRP